MDLKYSDEQILLREQIQKFCISDYDFYDREKHVHSDLGYDQNKWKLFADQGWLAMPFSEEEGGFNFGAIELCIMFEEFGKHLVLEPYLSNIVLSGFILDQSSYSMKSNYISGLISGNSQISLAYVEESRTYDHLSILTSVENNKLNGTKNLVLNGSNADNFLVTVMIDDEFSLIVMKNDEDGLSINNFKTVDDKNISQLSFDNVTINPDQIIAKGDEAKKLLQDALYYAALCISAEAIGCMTACYEKTVEYTKGREQFGQPISNFQVLQHRMVDMFIDTELCKSLLFKAMLDMHENNNSKYRSISALKHHVGVLGKKIAEESVQLHGGMGVSEEMSIGHYLKKFIVIDSQFGNSKYHLKQFKNIDERSK